MWPYFKEKIAKLILGAVNVDLPPVAVHMGLRTWEQQDALYALGRTVKNPDGAGPEKPLGNIVTKAKGGESWHCFGVAADIVFKPDGKWSWADKMPWGALGKIGVELGLEWGGVWKFKDLPHFQLRSTMTIQEAQEIYKKGGIAPVWDEIARRIASEPFVK